MAVDFCLATNTTYADISISVTRKIDRTICTHTPVSDLLQIRFSTISRVLSFHTQHHVRLYSLLPLSIIFSFILCSCSARTQLHCTSHVLLYFTPILLL